MILTVFGATGQVGQYLVSQALAQGHQVRAFGRNIETLIDKDARNDQLTAIKGYIFDEKMVLAAVKGADAVVSALGGGLDGMDRTRSKGMKNIVLQMEKSGVQRIVALGGMGILNADEAHYLMDMPDYPDEYKAVAREHLEAFLILRNSKLNWTLVGSPEIVNEKGREQYHISVDYAPSPNSYVVAAGDLAHFMLKEISANHYLQQRVGICSV